MLLKNSITIVFDEGRCALRAEITREEDESPEGHIFDVWLEWPGDVSEGESDRENNRVEMKDLSGKVAMKLRDFLNAMYLPDGDPRWLP